MQIVREGRNVLVVVHKLTFQRNVFKFRVDQKVLGFQSKNLLVPGAPSKVIWLGLAFSRERVQFIRVFPDRVEGPVKIQSRARALGFLREQKLSQAEIGLKVAGGGG